MITLLQHKLIYQESRSRFSSGGCQRLKIPNATVLTSKRWRDISETLASAVSVTSAAFTWLVSTGGTIDGQEMIVRLRKLKTGILALVATAAVVGAATTPAQATSMHTCNVGGGGLSICEYTIADYYFTDGTHQQFIIGTDYAVWTRWTNRQRTQWSGWTSLGGQARSGVSISDWGGGKLTIAVVGTDGHMWGKDRHSDGTWGAWFPIPSDSAPAKN
ncbi:hypothetical protein ACWD7F_38940 [Streptomyces sp. NPDC005122]